jgi:hypothetical protein
MTLDGRGRVFGLFDHVTKRTGMAFCCTSQEKGTSRRAARQAAIGYDLRVDANHVHNAFGLKKKVSRETS